MPASKEDAEDTVDLLLELINSPADVIRHLKLRRPLPKKDDMRALMERICLKHLVLPRRFYLQNVTLNERVPNCGPRQARERGKVIARLWIGTWDRNPVAVKRFEFAVDRPSDAAVHQAFCRTVLRFSQLQHKNVQAFLGVAEDIGAVSRTICLVTPWMPGQTMTEGLGKLANNPVHDVAGSPRKWVEEIAAGLRYLHDEGICHGDLHPANILIDDQGNVHLADFGFSWIAEAMIPLGECFHPYGGPLRYAAPEYHDPESFGLPEYGLGPTFASDMFAYACICYELYARKPPFASSSLAATFNHYLEGRRPARPVGADGSGSISMPDLIWSIVTRCWAQNAADRPSIQVVVNELLTHSAET